MDDDCPFCRFAAGEGDAHLVREDERTIAFLDENPVTEGHALVAPREHLEDVVTADEDTVRAVAETVRTVSTALERELDPDGFSVFHTSGSLVGRVTHAHVHVIPRRADDGVGIALSRTELDEQAASSLADRLATAAGE